MSSTAITWASSPRTKTMSTSSLADNLLAESSLSPPTSMAQSITVRSEMHEGLSDHKRQTGSHTLIAKPKPVSASKNDAKHLRQRLCQRHCVGG